LIFTPELYHLIAKCKPHFITRLSVIYFVGGEASNNRSTICCASMS